MKKTKILVLGLIAAMLLSACGSKAPEKSETKKEAVSSSVEVEEQEESKIEGKRTEESETEKIETSDIEVSEVGIKNESGTPSIFLNGNEIVLGKTTLVELYEMFPESKIEYDEIIAWKPGIEPVNSCAIYLEFYNNDFLLTLQLTTYDESLYNECQDAWIISKGTERWKNLEESYDFLQFAITGFQFQLDKGHADEETGERFFWKTSEFLENNTLELSNGVRLGDNVNVLKEIFGEENIQTDDKGNVWTSKTSTKTVKDYTLEDVSHTICTDAYLTGYKNDIIEGVALTYYNLQN